MTKITKKIPRAASITCVAIFALATVAFQNSQASPTPVQNMLGQWYGFVAVMGTPPEPVRFQFSGQTSRRFTGLVQPPEPVQPISIEGTVSASGKVNYQGQGADGTHLVGKTDLMDFGGGASILNGSVTRFSNDGTFIIPCVLVLRAFESNPPEPVQPAGRYVGTISSSTVSAQIDILLNNPPDPVRPTSFAGIIEITVNGQTLTFPLIATGNSAGHVIAIGHGTSGHTIVDAVLSTPPDPVQPALLSGNITVEFADGSELEGTFQTQQQPR